MWFAVQIGTGLVDGIRALVPISSTPPGSNSNKSNKQNLTGQHKHISENLRSDPSNALFLFFEILKP